MKSNIFKRGFLSLIVTQFFGAANDNVLKGVLTFMVIGGGRWDGQLGKGGQGVVALCFTVPFILLSGYAGQFADRRSKRQVSVLIKIVEVPIALVALAGFWSGHLWITLLAIVMLTCQSAFFGPAKYGMIPELVAKEDLSRANGTINMMTNIAVIAGTLVAGVVSDRYWPLVPEATGAAAAAPAAPGAGEALGAASALAAGTPGPGAMPWLPGAIMVAVALAGLAAVMFLPRLEPGDRNLRYDANPLRTYVLALRQMAETPLLMVALAWGYFYLLAGLALLIIPEYAVVLEIDREMASRLLGIMAIAIGAGSVAAGLISGRRIEPRLIPVGAAGLTLFFVLLGLVPPSFMNVAIFVAGAGFCAGFYIIPLQSMLQDLSPDDERGRFLGTANGISFAFLAVSSLLFWVIRPWFGDRPQAIFLVSAALMLAGTVLLLLRLRRTPMRYGRTP